MTRRLSTDDLAPCPEQCRVLLNSACAGPRQPPGQGGRRPPREIVERRRRGGVGQLHLQSVSRLPFPNGRYLLGPVTQRRRDENDQLPQGHRVQPETAGTARRWHEKIDVIVKGAVPLHCVAPRPRDFGSRLLRQGAGNCQSCCANKIGAARVPPSCACACGVGAGDRSCLRSYAL